MAGFLHKIRKYEFQYLEGGYEGDGDSHFYKELHGKDAVGTSYSW